MTIVHSLSVCFLTDAPSSYHPYACIRLPLSLKKTQAFQSIRIRKTCHELSHFLCPSSDTASKRKTLKLITYAKKSLVNSSMFQYLKKMQRISLMYRKSSFCHHILKFQEDALTEDNLLFLEAWRTIDSAYYDKTFNGTGWFRYREKALQEEPMNTREETYAAIKKMIKNLDDPFTRFLEPEKFKSLRSGTQGAVTGVGLSIGYTKGTKEPSTGLVVISATPGGPANRAGILLGDIILAIDNKSTHSMGIYDAADHLQGPGGSLLELTIRSSPSELKNISLKREKVTLNPVSSRMCEVSSLGKERKRIGYTKLTSFNQNASGAVKDAIESLRKNNVDAFVLDLRNNSGGLFPEGIEVAKIWMPKGVIVYVCDSRGVRDIYEADGNNAIATSEPLTVLVYRGTASASEILAGALKDNNRSVLYGEPTFGKGKIQSVFELSDGSGLAITVARYMTPSHIDIGKVGVFPDHRLPVTFPLDEDEVCSCIDDTTSSCSLDRAKLFSKRVDLSNPPLLVLYLCFIQSFAQQWWHTSHLHFL